MSQDIDLTGLEQSKKNIMFAFQFHKFDGFKAFEMLCVIRNFWN